MSELAAGVAQWSFGAHGLLKRGVVSRVCLCRAADGAKSQDSNLKKHRFNRCHWLHCPARTYSCWHVGASMCLCAHSASVCVHVFLLFAFLAACVYGSGRNMWPTTLFLRFKASIDPSWKQTSEFRGRCWVWFCYCSTVIFVAEIGYVCPLWLLVRNVVILYRKSWFCRRLPICLHWHWWCH